VFGKALVEIARANPKVVGITAAMPDGTGLDHLSAVFPERYFDVGIAEQHAVTFAAGLASQGCVPVVAIYSTFLQRAFDQMIHDVALQHLHVVFALDRAGVVGADGPTHHGAFDLGYLRMIPGMIVMAPRDESQLRDMLFTATEYRDGPIALRYPRGSGPGAPLKEGFDLIPIGRAERLRQGKDVALLAIGELVHPSLKAAEILAGQGIECEVVDMRFVKPLDADLLRDVASRVPRVVTLENNAASGGFGSAVGEFLTNCPAVRLHTHGIPDSFIDHGSPAELARELRFDAQGIAAVVAAFVQEAP
jgi:1-deoxy-D-xylulose-5-phosphate synthase